MRRGLAIGATAWAALAWVATAGGCSDDETVLGDPPPTEVAVNPLEFLGDLPCSDDPGAAKSYVATLTDTTPGFEFTLAAGPPASCASRMAFRFINIGHEYTAEVDVFDVPATELFPAGGAASGSRVMLDAAGNVVAPRWRTVCGEGPSGGAIAAIDTSVVVAGCDPLQSDGTGVTAIEVDPNTAFPGAPSGEIACTKDGGTVDEIGVLPSGPASETPLPQVTLACGDPIVFDQGLVAGASYAFRLEARELDENVARWAASCTAIAAEGVQRTATCSTFSASGTVSIATAAVDEPPGFVCGVAFDTYDLILEGPAAFTVPRTTCSEETLITPVPSGHYVGALRTYAAGALARTATCEVDVAPATTTSLACSFD